MNDNAIRLQKIIAGCGLASRRQAEAWIEEGHVTINGKTAVLGQKGDLQQDSIKVFGKLLRPPKALKVEKVTLVMNKPKGVICSNQDPFNNQTVFDLLPKKYQKLKLFCAGRLDKESEGLLILTNDGTLAQKITHPSYETTKRYQVTLSKPFNPSTIPKLLNGIRDNGEFLYAHKIIPSQSGPNHEAKLEVHLTQGHKREIRRLFEAFGYFVKRLKRFQIGGLVLKKIPLGTIKALNELEINLLLKK